jgi:short-subunit dehydrogenase
MKIKNKTIVVTGGGNGIGRELVLALLKDGARVAAVDISEKGLQETQNLAGELSKNLSSHVVDIIDKPAVISLPEKVVAIHGQVDGLINNAGIIQPFVKINDLEYETIERVMNVNFYGTLYMTKAFLPHFLKRPEAHIVNLSSMGGFVPVPGQSIYGAAKAGTKLLTEGLFSELKDTNVKVTIVFPGAIATNITGNSGVEMKGEAETDDKASKIKPLPADEAARKIIEGMEKDRARFCVGKDARFLIRLYRFKPKWATNLVAKKMGHLLK